MSKRTVAAKPKNEKRALAPKESTLFKELLNLYETKQLKRALKTADQILKKVPEHGETTSMRGLVLIHMGRREEGLEQVKKGAKLDLTSHIVWHVFGLVHKGEKNWTEAAKSYSMGLRFDKENQNILRDLAQLQTHLRQYDALVETRRQLLRLRPNLRSNWIAYALAYHLSGDPKNAAHLLSVYQSMVKNIPDYDVDQSETLLYQIRVLIECGLHLKSQDKPEEAKQPFEEALSILDANAKSRAIVDRTKIMEFRAHLLTYLLSPDAENAWLDLIDHNPDHLDYYQSYLALFSTNSPQALLDKSLHLSTLHPKSRLPSLKALAYSSSSTSPSFHELVEPYLKSSLEKGIPSLFTELKSLYGDQEKTSTIQKIVESVASEADYRPAEAAAQQQGSVDPSTYLWALYFLAQHHSFLIVNRDGHWNARASKGQKALAYVEKAIQHTPTLPELWSVKGRIHKRLFDPSSAAHAQQIARLLDGQDRFINTKAAKYLLRLASTSPLSSDQFLPAYESAQQLLGLFTKKDAPSPGQDLEDMQSLTYLVENAQAWAGLGGKEGLARSLKCTDAIVKVFQIYQDDQYDFHPYAVRKCNLNVYIDLIRWEGSIHLDSMYIRAVTNGAKILVAIFDNPKLLERPAGTADGNQQTTAESKKAKKKAAKKAHTSAATAQHQPGLMTSNQHNNEDKGIEPPAAKDEDPDGTKWLSTATGSVLMDKAWMWISPIVRLLDDEEPHGGMVRGDGREISKADKRRGLEDAVEKQVWTQVYDICARQAKWMQAVKALHRIRRLVDGDRDEELHWRIVDLKLRSTRTPPPEQILPAFNSSFSTLLPPPPPDADLQLVLEGYNTAYRQKDSNTQCGNKVWSWARSEYLIKGVECRDEVFEQLFVVVQGMLDGGGVQMDAQTALDVQRFIYHTLDMPEKAEKWCEACSQVYKLATVFEPLERRVEKMKWASEARMQDLEVDAAADREEKGE